jgi:hypothetical protein
MRTSIPDTAGRWREVERLLDSALDHEPNERSDFLEGVLRQLARGDARSAEPYLRDAVRSFRAALPRTHPDVARANRLVAECLVRLGRG